MSGLCRQAAVVVSAHRNAGGAADDALKIDGHSCGSFWGGVSLWFALSGSRRRGRLLSFRRGFPGRLLQFLVDVLCGRLRFLTGRGSFRCRGLRRFIKPGDRYFVALRREGMLHILAQGDCIDVGRAIRGIVKLNLRNLWLKLAIGKEVDIVTLWIPGGTVSIKHIICDLAQLAVAGAPDIDGGEAIRTFIETESKVVAARRPAVITNLTMGSVGNLDHLAIGQCDDINLSVLIRKGNALTIR